MNRTQVNGIVIFKETEEEAAARLKLDQEREERAETIKEAFQQGYAEARQ